MHLPESALRALLDPDEDAGALPFLAVVTEQVVYRLRARPPTAAAVAVAEEWAAAGRALALLREAAAGEVDGAARRLLAEPAMLTAFFQNVDLLYAHEAAQADAAGAVVMRAMEVLAEAPPAASA